MGACSQLPQAAQRRKRTSPYGRWRTISADCSAGAVRHANGVPQMQWVRGTKANETIGDAWCGVWPEAQRRRDNTLVSPQARTRVPGFRTTQAPAALRSISQQRGVGVGKLL